MFILLLTFEGAFSGNIAFLLGWQAVHRWSSAGASASCWVFVS